MPDNYFRRGSTAICTLRNSISVVLIMYFNSSMLLESQWVAISSMAVSFMPSGSGSSSANAVWLIIQIMAMLIHAFCVLIATKPRKPSRARANRLEKRK